MMTQKLLPPTLALLLGGFLLEPTSAQDSPQHPPMPDPGEGYFMFNEGNSLMGQLHTRVEVDGKRGEPLLPFLAERMGYPEHQAEGVGAAGIPIDWAWGNPAKRQEFFDDLQANEFDVFTVQPFGFQNRREPEVEAAAAAQMYREVLKSEGEDTPLLIYQTWPSGREAGGANYPEIRGALENNQGDSEKYLKGLQLAIDEHMNPIAHILRQDFPDKAVYIIPVPQAMKAFAQKIEEGGGSFAGVEHIAELLDTGGTSVHMSRKGMFLNAMTNLSAMYRENPAEYDLPVDYGTVFAFNLDEGMQPTGYTAEEGKQVAQLAWEVVSNTPATPVTREPFAFEDREAPQAATIENIEILGPKQARVTWKAGSDNESVLKQVIYRDGEYLTALESDATEFTVTGLKPGESNTVTVRTFDPTYNLTDATMEVTPSAIEGEQLVGWDLSKYTMRENDTDERFVPDENLKADEKARVISGTPTITRGPGLSDARRPFRSAVFLQGTRAESWGDAVAEGAYVTTTITPTDGASPSFTALEVPIRVEGERVQVALFTSATGFESGEAVKTLELPGGVHSVAFDLSEIQELQNLSEPVELRLYFAHSDRAEHLGDFGDNRPQMDIKLYGKP